MTVIFTSRLSASAARLKHAWEHTVLGFSYENRTVCLDVDLPPHSVAAITLELAPEPSGESAAA